MISPTYLEIALAIILIIFLYANKVETIPRIFGIYRIEKRRFFYLKYIIVLLFLRYKQLIVKFNRCPKKDKPNEEVLEAKNDNGLHHIRFTGSSTCGQVFHLSVDESSASGDICLKIPEFSSDLLIGKGNVKILENSRREILCVDFLNIEFEGEVRFVEEQVLILGGLHGDLISHIDQDKTFNIKIKTNWSAVLPQFHYLKDTSQRSFAKAVANEFWSKEYLQSLKILRGDIFEQHGEIKGTTKINGKTYEIFANCAKTKTQENLKLSKTTHRYVVHYITLETGHRISVGIASSTQNFSSIEIGFITCPRTGKNYAVHKCDLKLFQHGEEGHPPTDYSFTFKAGKKIFRVTVISDINNREYFQGYKNVKIADLGCSFTVNNVKGWGSVEWHYRK